MKKIAGTSTKKMALCNKLVQRTQSLNSSKPDVHTVKKSSNSMKATPKTVKNLVLKTDGWLSPNYKLSNKL